MGFWPMDMPTDLPTAAEALRGQKGPHAASLSLFLGFLSACTTDETTRVAGWLARWGN